MDSPREVLSQIDFNDASIESIRRFGDSVMVDYRNWKGDLMGLQFDGVVFCRLYDFSCETSGVDVIDLAEGFALTDVAAGFVAGSGDLVHLSLVGPDAMVILVFSRLRLESPVHYGAFGLN